MIKIVELIGFAGVGGTIYAFLGMTNSEYRWPVFLMCAGIAVAAIVYRRTLRNREARDVTR